EARNLGATNSLDTQINNQLNQFGRDAANGILGAVGSNGGFVQNKLVNAMFLMIKSGKVNISRAVSYAQDDHTVIASIAPAAVVQAGGNITVTGSMAAENNITAVGQTTSDSAAMGGAIAVTQFNHNVKAFIGKNAHVDATGNVTVD